MQKNKSLFPEDLKIAHKKHEEICRLWRKAGRPKDNLHPAKQLKLSSQRYLQNMTRQFESEKSINLQNKIMSYKCHKFTKVCKILKPLRGNSKINIDIPYIDTLAGRYSKQNVLEGFRRNTEILCNNNDSSSNFDMHRRQCCYFSTLFRSWIQNSTHDC